MKIILLLFPIMCFATTIKYYESPENYPVELQAVLSSIDLNFIGEDQREEVKKHVKNIEIISTYFSDKELSFIVKSSVYKTILSDIPDNKMIKFPSAEDVQKLRTRFPEEDFTGLMIWLPRAIATDITRLRFDPYLDFYTGKRKTKSYKKEIIVFQKKAKILLAWFYFLRDSEIQTIDTFAKDLAMKILKKLSDSMEIYAQNVKAKFNIESLADSSYKISKFKISELKLGKPESVESLNEILADVTKEDEPKSEREKLGLPSPVNDWILPQAGPKADPSTNSASNIIKKIDPTLEINEDNLPKPVNDWILEL